MADSQEGSQQGSAGVSEEAPEMDTSGKAAPPIDATASKEWIEDAWEEGGGNVTDTIKGRAQGEKSNLGYEKVYKKYENVAEEATQREEIPLTRRSYIKRYFESIRPKSRKK